LNHVQVNDQRPRQEKLSGEEVHLNFSSLSSAVVHNPVHPNRTDLRRPSCVDLDHSPIIFFAIPKFGVSDFMRHQEGLFEWSSNVLVDDERNLNVKGCTRAIEDRSTRGAGLDGNAEFVSDLDRELIRSPWVVPALDGFVVQSFSMLPREF
jgi:hypothetical protein